MKSQTVKTIGGVMSAVALISGGAGVAQAATIEPAAAAPARRSRKPVAVEEPEEEEAEASKPAPAPAPEPAKDDSKE